MDMALDDIIKQSQFEKKGPRGARRRGFSSRRAGSRGGSGIVKVQIRNANASFSPKFRSGGLAEGSFKRGRRSTIERRSSFPSSFSKRNRDSNADEEGTWQHDKFLELDNEMELDGGNNNNARGLSIQTGTKVRIENLQFTVTDTDLLELFEKVGPVKSATVHYDRSGRSEGVAEVTFTRRADATAAIQQFNGASIDGKPVTLTVATDTAALPRIPRRIIGRAGARRGLRAGIGGWRKRTGSSREYQITEEQLDAQLDAYYQRSAV